MILNKKFFLFFVILLFTFQKSFSENTDIYKKIDLFGEVLEKISKEYVDEVDQSKSMDWKLVDGIDLIVHIFHPDKRKFYELEKIWSEIIPKEKVMI